MHCGLPHPDLLLAVLDARQMREIEIYAGIEPISWDVGVSQPRAKRDIEAKIDNIFNSYEKK